MDNTETPTKERISCDVVSPEKRLEMLLEINAQLLHQQGQAISEQEKHEALSFNHPVSTDSAVAFLGLLTGAIPTTAVFAKLLISGAGNGSVPGIMLVLAVLSIAVTSATGYYSGKLVGNLLTKLETQSWPLMISALPFVGLTWGLIAGAGGGLIMFGVGAIFGGLIGALTGSVVLLLFGVLHRILKRDDAIERSLLLPIALGLTSAIAAFIIGL